MIDISDISAEVDAFLSDLLEDAPKPPRRLKVRDSIPKTPKPTVPRVRPYRPQWHSEALVLVTHEINCACGQCYIAPAGVLVRFRNIDGKTLWETSEHASATKPNIPRVERRIKVRTLFCHHCFEPDNRQLSFPPHTLEMWPAWEPSALEVREAIDSQLSTPLE